MSYDESAASRHEAGFVRSFIVRGRRGRWSSQLTVEKKRGKLLDKLNHPKDIDFRFATRVPPSLSDPAWIATRLRELGAGSSAHVISCDSALDGQHMDLDEALASVVGLQLGTIVSCTPGRLAYFESEDKGGRYILEHSEHQVR